MAIYAIGDIHGSLKALKTIFKQGLIKSDDTVVFLGDYVNRGPNSKGVFDWLIKRKEEFNFEFILGNHDIMMLNARNSPKKIGEWLKSGGTNTLDSYGIIDDPNWVNRIDQAHWNFLDTCLPYLEIGKFIFVHAGLDKDKDLEEQNEYHLFWKKFENPQMYDIEKKVICGHTSRKNGKIADFGHTICIHTFAHGGKWLTCLNVETGAFLKANKKGQVESGKLKGYAEKY